MLYTVWSEETKKKVNRKCLITSNGDYIDVTTGEKYLKSDGYYHTKLFKIKVIAYDEANERSGLVPWMRKKCIGCIIIVEEHYDGGKPIYWHEDQIKLFRKKVRKHNQLVNFKIDPEYSESEDQQILI